MLNALTPETLQKLHLYEKQRGAEVQDEDDEDVERGQALRQSTRDSTISNDRIRREATNETVPDHGSQHDIPENVNRSVDRSTARKGEAVKPDDDTVPEAQKVETRDMERQTSQAQRVSTEGTDEGAERIGTLERLKAQAEEPGHTEPDQNQGSAPSAREMRNRWARLRSKAPGPLAEFVGTTVAIYIGLAGNLSKTTSNGEYGNFLTQSLSWGFGFMYVQFTM